MTATLSPQRLIRHNAKSTSTIPPAARKRATSRAMNHYEEIILKAWEAYDPSRKISKFEDLSILVSTNRVVKITFEDDDFVIAKLSSFGKYDYFKEDHRIIQALSNNLLYPFE